MRREGGRRAARRERRKLCSNKLGGMLCARSDRGAGQRFAVGDPVAISVANLSSLTRNLEIRAAARPTGLQTCVLQRNADEEEYSRMSRFVLCPRRFSSPRRRKETKGTRQERLVNLAAKLTTKSQDTAGAQRFSSWSTNIDRSWVCRAKPA